MYSTQWTPTGAARRHPRVPSAVVPQPADEARAQCRLTRAERALDDIEVTRWIRLPMRSRTPAEAQASGMTWRQRGNRPGFRNREQSESAQLHIPREHAACFSRLRKRYPFPLPLLRSSVSPVGWILNPHRNQSEPVSDQIRTSCRRSRADGVRGISGGRHEKVFWT